MRTFHLGQHQEGIKLMKQDRGTGRAENNLNIILNRGFTTPAKADKEIPGDPSVDFLIAEGTG